MKKDNAIPKYIRHLFHKESEFMLSDSRSFTLFYEKTHLTVFRYVYGLSGGSTQEAEDLTAEAYARAWKTSRQFHGNERSALGWLLRIARNTAIDSSRQQKRRDIDESFQIEFLPDSNFGVEERVVIDEDVDILRGLLDDLPDDKREILVLRYILGWRVKRIAAYMDKSENNISVTIKRTLQNLQNNWPQE